MGLIKRLTMLAISAPLFAATSAMAREGVAMALPDKRVAVLSEGDLEPSSIGSYSVTLYSDDSFADFIAGAVFSRDGSVFDDNGKPRVQFADITGDGHPSMIIEGLTAGSGNHLQVDALRIDSTGLRKLISIKSSTSADVIAQLKAACKQTDCLR